MSEEQGPVTPEQLKAEMTKHVDALSFPYWEGQEVLWNGRKVIRQRPNWPSNDEE